MRASPAVAPRLTRRRRRRAVGESLSKVGVSRAAPAASPPGGSTAMRAAAIQGYADPGMQREPSFCGAYSHRSIAEGAVHQPPGSLLEEARGI